MYKKRTNLPEDQHFTVMKTLELKPFVKKSVRNITILFIILPIIMLFVHWQQTSYGRGTVIIFDPNLRPQNITALVSGRINKWFIKEGMLVKKGDKLVEIIDNDPNIIENLRQKQQMTQMQYENTRIAAETAKLNLDRQKNLFNQGIASRKEYEQALIKYNDYQAKVQAEQSKLADIQIQVSRQQTQTIFAPDNGQIVSVKSGGTSTSIKAGDIVATFLPKSNTSDFAIELMVDPNDMPLIDIGNRVRIQFEGWPIIQVSGWPSLAVGTFGGVVSVMDGYLQANGKLRVIIVPDPHERHAWPSARFLRAGVDVKAWILLRRVPLGYELWRKINKFPKNREKPGDGSQLSSLIVDNPSEEEKK
jgi:hypothetical protein